MTKNSDTRKTCKLCMRVNPNFCKRHAPRVIIKKVKMFTEEQIKNYLIGVLYEIEREYDDFWRISQGDHEFTDTCDFYKMMQRRRRTIKNSL